MTGRTITRKIADAVPRAEAHRQELEELEKILDRKELERWQVEYAAWEEDKSQPNPFESRVTRKLGWLAYEVTDSSMVAMTLSAVRLRLAEEEAKELSKHADISLHAEVSPFILISSGLDIQDLQRHLGSDVSALGLHATDLQKANITTRRNALQRKIDAWIQVQLLYMPSVAALRSQTSSDDAEDTANRAEKIKLMLPSELAAGTPCDTCLLRLEWDLRWPTSEGKKSNTRARSALDYAEKRKQQAKSKYTAARTALQTLAPLLGKVGWEDQLLPLHDADMRYLSDMLDGQTEGTRDMSWIWKSPDIAHNHEEGLQDSLRIEWCKARARAERWQEEEILLREEMRRIECFLEWEKEQWRLRALARMFVTNAEHEGCAAYAEQQGALWGGIIESTTALWKTIPILRSMEGTESSNKSSMG
ncbi:hypothetical protein JVU11DRAFT_9084 [Chiua virens]|nr:hypothetical protein JVU11DRAFT_9084 [Chiua virens]